VKKIVEIDEKADQELKAFSQEVQARFTALFLILEKEGYLKEPFAKKISQHLFEVRVKHKGQWRALYAYVQKNKVIVLSAFNKKTQKAPRKELHKAEKRLRKYL
jgi:phage-related protein